MNECKRFEEEGLLIVEQGGVLNEHFNNCEICLAEKAKYEKLKQILKLYNSDKRPLTGWEDAVLKSRIHTRQQIRLPRYIPALASGIILFAIGFYFSTIHDVTDIKGSLKVELVAGEEKYRGTKANIGDKLIVKATSRQFYFDIVIYRDGRFVTHCNGSVDCIQSEKEATFQYSFNAIGVFQVILLESQKPLVIDFSSLDSDMSIVRKQGGDMVFSKRIGVN